MICKNCGRENEEDAKVCVGCGATLTEDVSEAVEETVTDSATESFCDTESTDGTVADFASAENGDAANGSGDEWWRCDGENEEVTKKSCIGKVLAIAIPAVAVVGAAVASIALGVFTSPALKAQKAYYNALVSGDGETMYKYDIDQYELKDVQNGLGVESEDEVIKIYKESFEQYPEMFAENLGDNLKVGIYVADVHKYSKADTKKLDEHLVKYCDYNEGALQDIRVMDVLVTITGDKKDQRNYMEEVVAKIDGKWYVGTAGDIYDAQTIDEILSGEFDKEQEEKNSASNDDTTADSGSETEEKTEE